MNRDSVAEELVRIPSRVGALTGVLHRPGDAAGLTAHVVVGSHGLYSDRESQKLVDLGHSLASHGVAFLRYDCMGCGDSGGRIADTTLASRVTDLEEVLAWVRAQPDLGSGRLGLMGSSMGGFSSLCVAAEDREVATVAVWAAPATFDDLHDEKEALEPQAPGSEEYTPPVLGPGFYRTLHTPDLVALAPSLSNVIFLHGEDDETVPLDHAIRLHRLAGEPKKLEVFPAGDHRFSDPVARERAVDLTTGWLLEGLRG
jgi:dipeptidyl aminopeptidase/acylaminoacyl peptidase